MAVEMTATTSVPSHGAFARFDHVLGRTVEALAAALVVAELVLLGAATAARYVFNAPLIWSDELATVLFVWLAMLGAVVALRRSEHMRLTAFVRNLSPAWRARTDALGLMLVCTVLAALVMPSWHHLDSHMISQMPVLEISEGFREGAMLVGVLLMLLTAVERLVQQASLPQIIGALALVLAGAGALYAAAPVLEDLGNTNLFIFFFVLVAAAMVIGTPIAFTFLLATVAYLHFSTTVPVLIVPGRVSEGMSHMVLLAVPMFVLLGALIEIAGLARAMILFLVSLIGHLRGGLQYVLVAAMYLVSGISGSKAADMAAVAPVLFPEMVKRGARPGDLVALLSATGAQTETIPPSLVLITIGSVTGVSIAALFTGGLLPGLVLAAMLCIVVWQRYRGEDLSHVSKASLTVIAKSFVIALPAVALPFIIRAAVVGGVATATEVSTIGIVYSVLCGLLLYRRFDWRRLSPMLIETAALSGAILLIIGAATGMAWALTQSGFSTALARFMTNLPGGAPMFLAVTIVAFIVLGSVLEGIPAIVLFGPLLFPIAKQIGIHEVHYAMVVILAMGIGLFAPPFGVGYYAACAISRIHPDLGIRPMLGYTLALLIGTIVIAAVPWFSIGLLR